MSNTKHTPGPWKHNTEFHLYKRDDYSNIVAGDGFIDYTLGFKGFNLTGIMVDADAKLIAAAPELLQALIELHNYTKGHKDLAGFIKFKHLSEQAELAIKKATE